MMISSIKHQAILLFTLFTAGLTTLYLALAVISAYIVEDNIIYSLLKTEAQHIESIYKQTGQLPESNLSFVRVYANKAALPDFARQSVDKPNDDNEIFTEDEQHYHYKHLNLAEGKTGYLLAEVSDLLVVSNQPRVFETYLIGFVIALSIAIVLALKLASHTVKPVMVMAKAIKNDQAMPELKFELGYLANSLQQALDELKHTLQREQDFTTDVSHELRTPLTVLNNTLLLAEHRGVNQTDLAQLQQVNQQMQHTVDVLLALARSNTISTEAVLFKPIIEQVLLTCMQASGKEITVALEVEDNLVIETNGNLLNLLLTNLVNNAIEHGGESQLYISATESQILFSNSLDKDAEPLQQPQTAGIKSQSSSGIGQGLYLVTRILETLNWRYELNQFDNKFTVKISL